MKRLLCALLLVLFVGGALGCEKKEKPLDEKLKEDAEKALENVGKTD